MLGVAGQRKRKRGKDKRYIRPMITGEAIEVRDPEPVRRRVQTVRPEPMAVVRVPADPLVAEIKRRLETLEGHLALVDDTIAAIGDAARETLLEADTDDPGGNVPG
jgi:hypothetical protein